MNILAEKLEQLDSYGKVWAEKAGDKSYAEHSRKSTLSKIMIKEEAKGVKTAAAQERNARASDEYTESLLKLATAVSEEIQARTNYMNRRDILSAWQTDQANKRAEIRGQT